MNSIICDRLFGVLFSQVKKMVQKLVLRDTLNYRKITDQPISEDRKDAKDDEGEEKPMEDEEEEGKEGSLSDGLDLETLAKGNFCDVLTEMDGWVFQLHFSCALGNGR